MEYSEFDWGLTFKSKIKIEAVQLPIVKAQFFKFYYLEGLGYKRIKELWDNVTKTKNREFYWLNLYDEIIESFPEEIKIINTYNSNNEESYRIF